MRRAFGIEGVLLIAMVVPNQSRRRSVRILPYILFAEVVLSGSRTAMATAGFLLVFIALRGRRRGRVVKGVLIAAGILAGLVAFVQADPILHQRFFGGDANIHVGGLNINSTGRLGIWRPVIDQAKQKLWIGHGAGTATNLVRQISPVGEPHNDYLRLWDDFGLVGAALWLAGVVLLIRRCFARGRRRTGQAAGLHYAAAIGLAGMLLMSITDNVVIYNYFMFPLGVLVGASLAHPAFPEEAIPLGRALSKVNDARRGQADRRDSVGMSTRVMAHRS
jgi:O-antigen ligase